MKTIKTSLIMGFLAMFLVAGLVERAEAIGFGGEEFSKVFYLKNGSSGDCSRPSSPCTITDRDLMSIPADSYIDSVVVVIDTAVTGSTAIDIGDDDDPDGFCPTASLTLGTPGGYCLSAKTRGAYLRVQTAGGTDALDIDVVAAAKYYSASGKEVKVDNTTTNTAGALRVFVHGFRFPNSSY